jgi:type IV pilus assembly protein PilC
MKPHHTASYFVDLALLLEGGMVLGNAVDLLAEESAHHGVAPVIARAVKSGRPLSVGLEEAFHPLPAWIAAAVSAAERVGHPEKGLRLAATQLHEEKKWREEFSKALAYPVVLLATIVLVGMIMARTVLPSLAAMSAELGGAIPMTTQIAIVVGRGLGSVWAICLLVAMAAAVIWLVGGSSTARDVAARTPVLRSMVRLIETWRFFSIVAVLLKSAVPLHRAVESSTRVVTTPSWRAEAEELARRVHGGQSIGRAAGDVSWFPLRAGRVLSISASHGSLVDGVENIASWAEQERDRLLAGWARWLPVALLAVAALLIGFLAQAVLLPALSIDIVP